jgi:hypothetical protein
MATLCRVIFCLIWGVSGFNISDSEPGETTSHAKKGLSLNLKRNYHSHRLRAQEAKTSINQANKNNLEYIGSLYIGENTEPLDMVFDTGSDWLVVASHECATCNGRKYNHASSSSLKTYYNEDKIIYGSARADGYYARDLVCSHD